MKFYIYTLGCKANQADSDALASAISTAGHKIVGRDDSPDVCIVNTCAVTAKASYQSRQAVRRMLKRFPGAKVYVSGCDVNMENETLSQISGLSGVIERIDAETLLKLFPPAKASENAEFSSRSRPFIRIQDGCENFCSYCIVPMLRGPLKSRPEAEIIREIAGHKDAFEIVLTGIHIGKYGADTGTNLVHLLKKILKESKIGRIRLSSLEPDEITICHCEPEGRGNPDIITLIKESAGKIAPHLHIPLQSGNDAILKAMNRRYTTVQYGALLGNIRAAMPEICLGADVICGFPGETEEMFAETYEFIDSLPLSYLHVFTYSDRKGTPAFSMPGKVPEDVKLGRTHKLRALSTAKRMEYMGRFIGKDAIVVFDKGAQKGYSRGVSENYITVMAKGVEGTKSHHVVRLLKIENEGMIGQPV